MTTFVNNVSVRGDIAFIETEFIRKCAFPINFMHFSESSMTE